MSTTESMIEDSGVEEIEVKVKTSTPPNAVATLAPWLTVLAVLGAIAHAL